MHAIRDLGRVDDITKSTFASEDNDNLVLFTCTFNRRLTVETTRKR